MLGVRTRFVSPSGKGKLSRPTKTRKSHVPLSFSKKKN
ncbi:Uncharacterized protein dnm_039920 [Desulfonema magnum]|uniref:Uncharacterized protein n=1 Tax=Desulfonema magnum TaxID=45655 RepID=A0A975BM08_9BACT|nr:Uncharacterized protein dnm_039920 [Desulfonema magnum]